MTLFVSYMAEKNYFGNAEVSSDTTKVTWDRLDNIKKQIEKTNNLKGVVIIFFKELD